jgi:hypothetical protein
MSSRKKIKFITIFAILLSYAVSSTTDCNNITPNIIMDCSSLSTLDNSCCFYKKDNASYCMWWGSKYRGTVVKDGNIYQCDNPKGSSCGNLNPSGVTDCNVFSSSTNSCCYFKSSAGEVGCQWWGSYLKGTTEWNGRSMQCAANNIKNGVILLFAIFLTLL